MVPAAVARLGLALRARRPMKKAYYPPMRTAQLTAHPTLTLKNPNKVSRETAEVVGKPSRDDLDY